MWVNQPMIRRAGPLMLNSGGVLGALPVPMLPRPAYPRRRLPQPVRGAPYSLLGALGPGSTVGSAVQYAKFGSVAGPFGMAIGALVGGILSSLNRTDQENANFTQAMAIADTQGPQAVINIANKYLVLAGLFDLEPGQIKGNIPIYKKYGRMNEYRFVSDMMNLVYQAAQQGRITPNDTPDSVMARIVQPWIDSWGFGPMVDHNAAMINAILTSMIAEYAAGLQTRWVARGGDNPFRSLPAFAFAPAPAPAVVASNPVGPVQAVQAPVTALPVQPTTGFPIVASPPVVTVGAGGTSPTPIVPATTAQPAVGTTVVPVTATAAGQPDINALAQQLLAQGQSQQQAYQSAMASLQAAGVPPSAAIQQQTAQAVTTAGVSGVGPWVAGIAALLAISFALARPAARPAKGN